ncbi:hypothetical protein MHB69_19095 [Bacillus sp. FSL K6-0994]|uniref:hypothetical protein n=1 Tax=Bacillus sp. FSL K6-0994 TaxID=2921457 RepID=UPI00315A244F
MENWTNGIYPFTGTSPAFVFYLLALGGHALYAFFQGDRPPVTFVILMAGLLVFFSADWLFNKKRS